MPSILFLIISAILILALGPSGLRCEEGQIPPAGAPGGGERFFEMRTYTTNPGKLEALHARFRDHTNALFAKHGMTIIGFWTPVDGQAASNTLVYMLAYPSRAARDAAWKAFQEDPDWIKAKADSEVNGPLVSKVVSVFMRPTDYSPIK